MRATAIAAAARRLFEALGVWQGELAQPILDMAITDSRVTDAVRPVFLTFDGEIAPGEPFAHMVENRDLLAALIAKARDEGVTLRPSAIMTYETGRARIAARLGDGATIAARVLVAADGARSRLRELAGIQTFGWGYGQSAIVTTVTHERAHLGRAEEHFLPGGPFAILPLKGNRSSIVWTEETHEADRIVALPDEAFHDELERRFGLRLGDIAVAGPRRAFPVGLSVARAFVAERLALIGDAAHVIHPIAGSGSIPVRLMCWSAISAGGASTPWRWGSRPTGSTGCSPTAPTRYASCATSASASSTACRP
jgi:2-octaprenyl-6-methoxyphenol hydroxylase